MCGVCRRVNMIDQETERIQRLYDREGARLTPGEGGFLFRDGRSWLASQARGDTLEIGIGAGATLPYYPTDVRLTGIDISPVMLGLAEAKARTTGREVTLQLGDARRIDTPDATFDTVVFCIVLCTVPDDRAAVMEAARVLRPGGRLLALEHVRSTNAIMRALERLLDPMSVRRAGDHLMRDPLDHLAVAGLKVLTIERSRLGLVDRLVAGHV